MHNFFVILNNQTLHKNHLDYSPIIYVSDTKSIGDFNKITGSKVFIADGGINFIQEDLLVSNQLYWVGDKDSTTNYSLLDKIPASNISDLNTDKDYSDFGKVLDIIYSHKQSCFIEVYNGLFGEKSHELSNIHDACFFVDNLFKHQNLSSTVFFYPSIIITNDSLRVDMPSGSSFSIIPTSSVSTDVKIEGAYYEGEFSLVRPSMGTRNISTSKDLCISSINHSSIMIVLD